MATEGTFVLADIGGYTSFLTGVGIEHAKEITSHLFNSLLKCNRGRWKVANVEGDCLFFYREGREPVEDLVAHVKALYEDFCRGTTEIAARSRCACGACTRTNDLRLKFIAHAGEFDRQKIGNRTELIGSDIVVAHRLLKNNVEQPEYLLMTRAFAAGGSTGGLPHTEGVESYEDVGNLGYVALDLRPLRRDYERSREVFVQREDALMAVDGEI